MKKQKIYKAFSFLIVIIFFLVGFFLINHSSKNIKPKTTPRDIYVQIGGQNVKVDLALTGAEQAQGLSGRQSLSENEGLLFVFNTPGNYPFWMKDMNFPIDMIWIDENMKVIYIQKDATPESYPATYGPIQSDKTTKYVLEVSAGFADKNNLKIGDSVSFNY